MSAEAEWDERILRIHQQATIVLGYMNPVRRYRPDGVDFLHFLEEDAAQGSLPRLIQGGVDVAVLSLGVETEPTGTAPGALSQMASVPVQRPVFESPKSQVQHLCRSFQSLQAALEVSRRAEVALTVEEAQRINALGKMAVFLHLTGAWIGGDLDNLATFYHLGVRAIHPAVEGLQGVATQDGLTPLGRDLVQEMNRLGMVVDLSHASDAAAWQMLELSSQPVIASHSNARALCPIPRNLPDDLAQAIAQKGGVIGVHFASHFVVFSPQQARRTRESARVFAEWVRLLHQRYPNPYEFLSHRYHVEELRDLPPPYGFAKTPTEQTERTRATVAQLCEHVDHLVNCVGIEHVGIGSDYDLGDIVEGLHRADLLPNLTAELVHRGYSEADIRKLWGENFLRVFRQVLH